MEVNGAQYLDEGAELFPNGSVHDATLARDINIQGLPCASGRSVVFFPSGRLRLAWLSRPAAVGDVACATGIVYLHEGGALLNTALAEDHPFGEVVVSAGARVTLDEVGRLLEHSKRLGADQLVGGLPCSAAFHVWLYPSGRPSLVVLASPCVIGRRKHPRGTQLVLDERGRALDRQAVDLDSEPQKKSGEQGEAG
jgi:hypothetical protein